MALQGAIPISFDSAFPAGAFMVGAAEPLTLWEDGKMVGQQHDKDSGKPMWSIRVIDADPEARKGQGEVTAKLVSATPPVAPPATQGLPFHPVAFDDLAVVPYTKEGAGRPRIAFSFRATGLHAPERRKAGESQ